LEWYDPSQALDAIAACNHYVIRDAGMVLFISQVHSANTCAAVIKKTEGKINKELINPLPYPLD